MPDALRKPLTWLVLALIVIGAGAWLYDTWTAKPKAEARLGKAQAGAALDSGRDAVGTVGQVHAGEAATDTITRENADAIRSAPGAAAPVDPALRDAGRRSLCRRPSYSGRPECLQYAAPR